MSFASNIELYFNASFFYLFELSIAQGVDALSGHKLKTKRC